jgi:hypothetical protein
MKCNYWDIIHFDKNKNKADLLSGASLIELMEQNSTKSIHFKFVNNPLKLDSTNSIILLLGKYIIYDGVFSKNILVRIPIEKINKKATASIHIKKNDIYYSLFYNKEVFTVKNTDDLIDFIFTPDSEPSFYINSTESERF